MIYLADVDIANYHGNDDDNEPKKKERNIFLHFYD